jgi:hypothetical protein
MRFRAASGLCFGFLLSTLPLPTPARAQSHTDVWVGLSVGLFDGFGLGMTHYAHSGGLGARVSVATGTTRYADYGIYDEWGGRYGDYGFRRGYDYRDRDYADYCWDRAWDLRWNRRYNGWDWDWYDYPTYDHLDFYHDCLSGGLGYAYGRWGSHARRAYYGRGYGGYGRYHRGWGVNVQIYVTDPFWRPWGPYWAYDPWGWYWDGFRDGRRSRWWGWDRGWDSYGGVVYGPGVRTAWGGRGGYTRPSPLGGPDFKEDPTDRRTAIPRGRAVPLSAPATGAGLGDPDARTGARRPAVDGGGRTGRPGVEGGATGRVEPGDRAPDTGIGGGRTARARPSDGLRGGGRFARPEAGPGTGDGVRGDRPEPVAPRVRGSDGETRRGGNEPSERALPRVRPSEGVRAPRELEPRRDPDADRGDADPRAEPRVRSRGEPREPAAEPRVEPRDYPRAEPRDDPEPRVRERPSRGSGGGERAVPPMRERGGSERSAPPMRERGGGERSAPPMRERGGERSEPAVRSRGGERSAPPARSDGGERGGTAVRRRGGDEQR